MARISVIMTARNAAATIRPAMVSTLRALPRDAELLVLDDASTDGTLAAVGAVSDRRVTVARSEENLGYVAGRKRLLDGSDSEYVAIMDSDDIAFPWRFTLQLRALADGLDLVVSPVVSFWTTPRRVRPGLPLAVSGAAFPFYLAYGCPFSHPTLTMRRSALDRLAGYRDVVAEDYDLYVRACLAGLPIARTSVPVLAYRRHPGQTSNNAGYDSAASSDARQQETLTRLRRMVCSAGDAAVGGRDTTTTCSPERLAVEAARRGVGRLEIRRLLRYVATTGATVASASVRP